MAGIWYRAGTVAVTSGSTKVVGTGTTWRSGVYKPDKGHIFWGPDGRAYEVDYVESDTVLYLVTAYVGGPATGQAYSIVISITGQVPAFSRELSVFVAYHQGQMDGWQQLLTGTGDVTLTAPDGTKLTVPSWEKIMNAGYGVVAQAAAQAAIATTEATKAAASAGVAANIVAEAALPLPDVWAPLSDSLRMITGYGRDVLVGSDVVARVMSFSRSTTKTYRAKDGTLKVAAVNEPAFERDGLLREYQSSNFNTKSEGFLCDSTSEGAVTATELDGAAGQLFLNTNGSWTSVSSGSPSCTPGQKYTCSFDTDRSLAECSVDWIPGFGISRIPSSSFREVKIRDGLYRRFATVVGDQSSAHQHFYVGTVPGGCKISRIQVEPGSVATSYIPTNGASATRAADVISIPTAPNWPAVNSVARTVAMEVSNCRFDAGFPRMFIYNDGTGGMRYDGVAFASSEAIGSPALGMTAAALAERHIHVERHTPSHLQVYASNVGMGPVGTRGNNPDYLDALALSEFASCHIRNFRIWHRELTDAQVKAIA